MGNSALQEVNHHPYLGIELSNDLSWSKHINQTVSSANKVLGLLKRNLWNCSPSVKDIAYKTLVRPKLEYAGSIWNPYHITHIESIEKVQRRAARFVKNDYSHTSSINSGKAWSYAGLKLISLLFIKKPMDLHLAMFLIFKLATPPTGRVLQMP